MFENSTTPSADPTIITASMPKETICTPSARFTVFCPLSVDCWLLVVGCWLLVVGCWLLVVDCWLLVVGYWLLLVIGCWLLIIDYSTNPYQLTPIN
jgi:hypothetical protein